MKKLTEEESLDSDSERFLREQLGLQPDSGQMAGFTDKVSGLLYARHQRAANRRLLFWFPVLFCLLIVLALALCSLVSAGAGRALLKALLDYMEVFLLSVLFFYAVLFTDCYIYERRAQALFNDLSDKNKA